MAKRMLDIRIRIERQEKKILQLKDKLEKAQDEYQRLLEEQKEQDKKKLFEAYKKTSGAWMRSLIS